jgi:hypothetical protein
MDNIPQEISVSLETLLSLLTATNDAHSQFDAAALVTASDSLSTTFTASFSSNNNNNKNGFEIRRAARRLDRALESLERALLQHEESQHHHDDEPMTLGPLLQSNLVTILTTLGQATDQFNRITIQELYETMAVTASRILVLNPRFILHQDEELDALVDRIGALLMRTRQQDDAVLYALVTCVNTHVLHVQQRQQQQQHDETSVAFPLLQGMEATVLAKLVLEKCKQDLACRWNLSANDSRRLDLWSFCTLLLKHMTQCRSSTTSNNLQEWLHQCFRHEQQQQQHDSTATLKAKVDEFMKACTMFGEELLEMGLDILDQATESMETTTTTTTTTTVNNVAIHSTWTCLSTTQVLQEGLGIQLPYSMVQSLFTAYASFVAVLCHKTANELKPFACELLVELAHYVLLQQEPATCSSAAMETALSITLFCALDSGISKDDALLSLILEHMHAQSSSNTTSASFPQQAQKRQRREQDEACPFTNILQSCVMASLMFPSHSTSTSTMDQQESKDSVARLLQSIPLSEKENPWHSLVARKVQQSFDMDTTTTTTNTTGDEEEISSRAVSWTDRILEQYVVDHQQRPLL